jgi:hypothetical protein
VPPFTVNTSELPEQMVLDAGVIVPVGAGNIVTFDVLLAAAVQLPLESMTE